MLHFKDLDRLAVFSAISVIALFAGAFFLGLHLDSDIPQVEASGKGMGIVESGVQPSFQPIGTEYGAEHISQNHTRLWCSLGTDPNTSSFEPTVGVTVDVVCFWSRRLHRRVSVIRSVEYKYLAEKGASTVLITRHGQCYYLGAVGTVGDISFCVEVPIQRRLRDAKAAFLSAACFSMEYARCGKVVSATRRRSLFEGGKDSPFYWDALIRAALSESKRS